MNKTMLFLVLAGLAAATAAGAQEAGEKALKEVSKKFLTAWNKGDAAGIAALYAPDAVLTTPGGTTVRGRQAIQEGVATDLREMAGAKMAFFAEEFRALGADAAVWRCEWKLAGMKGGASAKGTGLAVVTRSGAEWLIVEDITAMTPARPAVPGAKPAGHRHGGDHSHDHGPGGHGHDH